jgi:hypothetical protein
MIGSLRHESIRLEPITYTSVNTPPLTIMFGPDRIRYSSDTTLLLVRY